MDADGVMNVNLPDSAAAILTEDGVRHLLFAEEVEEGDDGFFDCGGTHLSLDGGNIFLYYASQSLLVAELKNFVASGILECMKIDTTIGSLIFVVSS